MNEIIKIVIKGSSGFCPENESYKDKVTITKDFIEYNYIPNIITENNPIRKWKYKTNNILYKYKFDEISKQLSALLKKKIDIVCTDVGIIEFNVTYSNNKKTKNVYYTLADEFYDLFKTIKSIVPNLEFVPAVLLTEDDYE